MRQQPHDGGGEVDAAEEVGCEPINGRKFRILSMMMRPAGSALPLPAARRLRSEDVPAALAELFVTRGPPAHIRPDNGPEFIANAVQEWLAKADVKTPYHHARQSVGKWLLRVVKRLNA